jgi:hypothetical protein
VLILYDNYVDLLVVFWIPQDPGNAQKHDSGKNKIQFIQNMLEVQAL